LKKKDKRVIREYVENGIKVKVYPYIEPTKSERTFTPTFNKRYFTKGY